MYEKVLDIESSKRFWHYRSFIFLTEVLEKRKKNLLKN